MSTGEVKDFVAPADGVFRVVDDGTAHEYSLDEGGTLTLEWEAE